MATINTRYIISTKKNALYKYCIGFYINKGIFYSVFHSISAFCNAGIDILGDNIESVFNEEISKELLEKETIDEKEFEQIMETVKSERA